MRGRSVASASAKLAATVDLPTPPLPLAIAITRATPGIGCGPRGRAPGAASRTISTGPGMPGMAAIVARTASSICCTTSAFAVLGASRTVTPLEDTSMSRTMPKETMSREKPG